MRLLVIALMVLTAAPLAVQAADLFIKKQGVTIAPAPAESEPAPAVSSTTPPPQVTAGTAETINEFSIRYYKSCMSKQDTVLKGSDQQLLCSCSSQKLTETMTVEDVKTMATDTAEGQFQRNRLLLQVYAPCMEYPARALLLRNCSEDKNVQKTIPAFETACTCMADKMAANIAANGPSVIAKSLKENPNDSNPLASLLSNADFRAQAKTELAGCVMAAAATPAPAAPQ